MSDNKWNENMENQLNEWITVSKNYSDIHKKNKNYLELKNNRLIISNIAMSMIVSVISGILLLYKNNKYLLITSLILSSINAEIRNTDHRISNW